MPTYDEAVYKVPTNKRWVALTFDIGWGKDIPGPVLRLLQEKKVMKATFFLSATWAAHYPSLARRVRSLGYEIGSHGYMHVNYTEHSDRWIHGQVKKAERIIQKVIGVKTNLIRTPNGDLNPRVVRKLSTLGYRTIHWSVDSMDWTNPGVDTIVRRVLGKTRSGDIILMHASDSARQTVLALPRIIDGLRKKGFQLVTVSKLLEEQTRSSSAK